MQKGIDIRKNNQAIAPAGNSAIAGLATVAMAQVEELNLTMGLGMGGVNFARDNATVTKLIADFNGGIGQNMKNLAAVCIPCPLSNPNLILIVAVVHNGMYDMSQWALKADGQGPRSHCTE